MYGYGHVSFAPKASGGALSLKGFDQDNSLHLKLTKQWCYKIPENF